MCRGRASGRDIRSAGPAAGPATPILVVTTTVTPPRGWGSLALRSDKGDLLACGNRVAGGEATHDLYRIPLSKSFATSESPSTTPVRLFSGQSGYGYDICDGVAWDTVENQIYQKPDVFNTVYRFDEAGASVGTSVTVPVNCNPIGAVGGASGLAVSGQSLYLGCANTQDIYRVNKNTGTVIEIFGSPQVRTEDLECDPVSFSAQQKDVLWTKGAYDNNLIAVEVARGTSRGSVSVGVCGRPLR